MAARGLPAFAAWNSATSLPSREAYMSHEFESLLQTFLNSHGLNEEGSVGFRPLHCGLRASAATPNLEPQEPYDPQSRFLLPPEVLAPSY